MNLPEDLSPEREAVIRAACSLVGKVNYFWGGKSLVLGWDKPLGTAHRGHSGREQHHRHLPALWPGLLRFVDWVFYNATGGEYIIGHGGGAMAQHSYCTNISWAEAQIGDLVFYPEDTHVGIVCGWDESGNILILHCAFSANNVVITGQEGLPPSAGQFFMEVHNGTCGTIGKAENCTYISDLRFLPKSDRHFPQLKEVDISATQIGSG